MRSLRGLIVDDNRTSQVTKESLNLAFNAFNGMSNGRKSTGLCKHSGMCAAANH